MPAKTDDPTGVNWNGAATNERERVGAANIRSYIKYIVSYFGAMVTPWLQLINGPLPYSRGDSEYNLDVNADTILDVFWKCPE